MLLDVQKLAGLVLDVRRSFLYFLDVHFIFGFTLKLEGVSLLFLLFFEEKSQMCEFGAILARFGSIW